VDDDVSRMFRELGALAEAAGRTLLVHSMPDGTVCLHPGGNEDAYGGPDLATTIRELYAQTFS
jgi:hypothetical protein